jgi:hypothetical protein
MKNILLYIFSIFLLNGMDFPKNSHLSFNHSKGWECDKGYKRIGDHCVEIKTPTNSKLNYLGDDWICGHGFIKRGEECIHVNEATDKEIKELLISASILSYPGNCPCPYFTDRAGRRCGRRSAWSREGGYSPLCYESDVSSSDVQAFRKKFQ